MGIEHGIDHVACTGRKFDAAQRAREPPEIGREILADFELGVEAANSRFPARADHQRAKQRPSRESAERHAL